MAAKRKKAQAPSPPIPTDQARAPMQSLKVKKQKKTSRGK
jgi:hypothetical protein